MLVHLLTKWNLSKSYKIRFIQGLAGKVEQKRSKLSKIYYVCDFIHIALIKLNRPSFIHRPESSYYISLKLFSLKISKLSTMNDITFLTKGARNKECPISHVN